MEFTDEQKQERDEMKIILEKKKNGESLTDAEQTMLEEYNENKPEKNSKATKQKRVVKNLSTKVKSSINTAVVKISKAHENLSDEQKIQRYEKYQDSFELALDKINRSTKYTDTQKDLYTSIINQLLNQLDDIVEEIE
jgi:cobalamin biosynthesis protein CobT